jgi:hypothetical protein
MSKAQRRRRDPAPELADSTLVEMSSANCSLPPKQFAVRGAYSAQVRYATTYRSLDMLEETAETTHHTLATLSVAVRQINGLVSHAAPIPT